MGIGPLLLVILALGIGSADPAFTKPSKSDATGDSNEIWLGMSTALTGPGADLGLNMWAGILAASEESHQNGGVHGLRPRHLLIVFHSGQDMCVLRRLAEATGADGIIQKCSDVQEFISTFEDTLWRLRFEPGTPR